MADKSDYTVTIHQGDDDRPSVVNHVILTEAEVDNLALRLEALVEAEYIDDFRIKPLPLPALGTESSIYTAICGYWGNTEWPKIWGAWEQGWKNRDAYFTRNAEAKVR